MDQIRGTTQGGATSCERVPDGAQLTESGSSWEECPKGYYSDGGSSKCAKCPANTFNPYSFVRPPDAFPSSSPLHTSSL